jgi:hypothetical protein
MKTLKLVVPTAVLMFGVLFSSAISFAKPEYTKKEKVACATCHVTAQSKDLNPTGECYKKNNHSLATCQVKK